jgi:hypothetical protein
MSVAQLDPQQQEVVSAIRAEARRRGAPRKHLLAAFETGLVEDNLHNDPGGDGDSAGWRQERRSIYKDPTKLRASVRRFFDEAQQLDDGKMTSGQLAAAVQRPRADLRGRYWDRRRDAAALLEGSGAQAARGALAARRDGESAPGAAAATVSPADKLGALLPMLQGRQSPADALMGLQQLQAAAQPSMAQQVLSAPAPQRSPRNDAERSLFMPGGGWGGTAHPVERFSRIMHARGLQTTSGKRDRHGTASGGWSDHAKDKANADARDWSGSVADMDDAAVELAHELGIKGYKKGRPLVATVEHEGIRYQVIYRSHVGGNHYDHIHMGAMAQ